jgi:nucleoporin NDC1
MSHRDGPFVRLQTATRSRQTSPLERLARQLGLVNATITGRVTNVTLQPVEEVSFALEAAARNAVARLASVYGDKLRECVLREARAKPAYGTPADLASLLTSMMS